MLNLSWYRTKKIIKRTRLQDMFRDGPGCEIRISSSCSPHAFNYSDTNFQFFTNKSVDREVYGGLANRHHREGYADANILHFSTIAQRCAKGQPSISHTTRSWSSINHVLTNYVIIIIISLSTFNTVHIYLLYSPK